MNTVIDNRSLPEESLSEISPEENNKIMGDLQSDPHISELIEVKKVIRNERGEIIGGVMKLVTAIAAMGATLDGDEPSDYPRTFGFKRNNEGNFEFINVGQEALRVMSIPISIFKTLVDKIMSYNNSIIYK